MAARDPQNGQWGLEKLRTPRFLGAPVNFSMRKVDDGEKEKARTKIENNFVYVCSAH